MHWPFEDPPNVAVFTSKNILDRSAWIQTVTHDEEDGSWQFHPSGGTSGKDLKILALSEVVAIDASINQLADLPVGWRAWRGEPGEPWQRANKRS